MLAKKSNFLFICNNRIDDSIKVEVVNNRSVKEPANLIFESGTVQLIWNIFYIYTSQLRHTYHREGRGEGRHYKNVPFLVDNIRTAPRALAAPDTWGHFL